jgi:DNA-binding response OmpR family regulator
MNSDESSPRESTASGHRPGTDALAARVVLVADGDPTVTDDLAAVLRDHFSVRTAYDSADALTSLDADVGVVLLDPEMPGLSVRHVLDRVTAEAVDCQVAALVAEPPDQAVTTYDDYLVKPVDPDELVATVDRLSRRAAYRTALEEYYALSEQCARLPEGHPDRADLERRIEELREEIDDVFVTLDGPDAYDAALRELRTD